MQNLLNRLKEPSTWAGLSVLGTLFGIPPGALDIVHQVAIGVGAVAAICLPEQAK